MEIRILLNLFMLNVFSYLYKFDESTSNVRVVGWQFSFVFKYIRNLCKQTVENLIRPILWPLV